MARVALVLLLVFVFNAVPSDLYIQVRMTLPGDTSCQDYLVCYPLNQIMAA